MAAMKKTASLNWPAPEFSSNLLGDVAENQEELLLPSNWIEEKLETIESTIQRLRLQPLPSEV